MEAGGYVVLRHDDVVQLMNDPRLQAAEAAMPVQAGITAGVLHETFAHGMLTANGEVHARRRSTICRTGDLSQILQAFEKSALNLERVFRRPSEGREQDLWNGSVRSTPKDKRPKKLRRDKSDKKPAASVGTSNQQEHSDGSETRISIVPAADIARGRYPILGNDYPRLCLGNLERTSTGRNHAHDRELCDHQGRR
jgi:hypothetical protein